MKKICLVTGGSGFLGKSLVRLLSEQEDTDQVSSGGGEGKIEESSEGRSPKSFDEIRVLDRDPFDLSSIQQRNRSKVVTREGDLTKLNTDAKLSSFFEDVDTVFHLAAIVDVNLTKNPLLHKVNVEATKAVINICKQHGVRRLVHTSSMDVVMDGYGHTDATEDSSAYPRTYLVEYIKTKVEGEKLVLSADNKDFSTCSIRPAHLYGPQDFLSIPTTVNALKEGKVKFILGDGSALFDVVYIDNVSHALILAAQNLFPGSKLSGQPYFICEDYHVNYFDWIKPYAQAKGVTLPKSHLPVWLLLIVGFFAEVLHWLINGIADLSCIRKYILKNSNWHFEPTFHRYHIYVLCRNSTFSHAKATKDFGYQPKISREEALKRTLEWYSAYKG